MNGTRLIHHPVTDRVLSALQRYPGARMSYEDIQVAAGHVQIGPHLAALIAARRAIYHRDTDEFSTLLWPQDEDECEAMWSE